MALTKLFSSIAVGFAVSLAAFGATPAVAKTVNEGVLSVGSDLTYPPYAYFDNKVPSGFDADFSRLMAEKRLESQYHRYAVCGFGARSARQPIRHGGVGALRDA